MRLFLIKKPTIKVDYLQIREIRFSLNLPRLKTDDQALEEELRP
jgi:hypothetical protein